MAFVIYGCVTIYRANIHLVSSDPTCKRDP